MNEAVKTVKVAFYDYYLNNPLWVKLKTHLRSLGINIVHSQRKGAHSKTFSCSEASGRSWIPFFMSVRNKTSEHKPITQLLKSPPGFLPNHSADLSLSLSYNDCSRSICGSSVFNKIVKKKKTHKTIKDIIIVSILKFCRINKTRKIFFWINQFSCMVRKPLMASENYWGICIIHFLHDVNICSRIIYSCQLIKSRYDLNETSL